MAEKLYTGKEWQDRDTAGDLEGEFVDPVENLTVEGKLFRAFATEGEFGIQAAYAIRGIYSVGEGKEPMTVEGVHLVGEKAFFRDAIREVKLGTSVRITFLKKEPIERKGKKTGQSMWRGKFADKADGDGITVRAALGKWYAQNKRAVVAAPVPTAIEDVPF